MKSKSKFLIIFLLILMSIPIVAAAVPGPGTFNFNFVVDFIKNFFTSLASLFSFGWLDSSNAVGFFKFLLWIVIFTVFYAAGEILFAKIYGKSAGAARRNAIIISLILATSTAILTPGSLVLSLFTSYASIIMFVLLGGAIGGIIWIIYPGMGRLGVTGPALHLIRIAGLFLCWWILATISAAADTLAGVNTFQYILPVIYFDFNKRRDK